MADVEDEILVGAALQGKSECFNELCRRYYPTLVAVADSILLDYHLAEDAAQEALAAACRGLGTLRKPEYFGAWVGVICRNVAKDMLRQRPGRREVADADAKCEADCVDDEQDKILSDAIQRLPTNLREVIFLRFYNEMSYGQMAKVLGISQQSIDGRLHRAKKKIAGYLKRKCFRS